MAALGLVLLQLTTAHAGGFAVDEQGVRSMGLAGAFLPSETDPAVAFGNPAAIAFLRDHSLSLGGNLAWTMTKIDGLEPFPGVATGEESSPLRLRPVVSFAYPASEYLVLGLGLRTPFELHSSWSEPETFSGRFLAREALVVAREITPTVGLRLADRLAIGAGVGVFFSKLDITRNLPAIDPFTFKTVDAAIFEAVSDTAWAMNYRAGLVAKFANGVTLSVAYDSAPRINLTGTGTLTRLSTPSLELDDRLALLLPKGSLSFETALDLPAQMSGSLSYTGNDWGISADVRLRRWSALKTLRLTFIEDSPAPAEQPGLDTILARDFEDNFQLRLGVERRVSAEWTLRVGFIHDPTPAPVESVSPAFVDANRNGVSAGFTWSRQDFTIDAAQTFSFFAERSTLGVNPEGYDGSYKRFRANLGISLAYRF